MEVGDFFVLASKELFSHQLDSNGVLYMCRWDLK